MTKKAAKTKTTQEGIGGKYGEIIGILIILAAILLTLALVSYNAADPSLNTITSTKPTNFIGTFGAYLAEALFMVIGYGAYVLPLILVYFSYFYFTNRRWLIKVSQVVGYLVFLACLCIYLRLAVDSKITVESGGIVGMLLGDLLRGMFGKVGAYLVVSAFFLISLVVTLDVRFSQIGAWILRTAQSALASITTFLEERVKKKKPKEPKERKEPMIHEAGRKNEPRLSIQIESVTAEPNVESKSKGNAQKPGITPSKKPEKKDQEAKIKVRAPVDRAQPATKIEYVGFTGDYRYPSIDMLTDHTVANITVDRNELVEQSHILETKLASFKIEGSVVEVHPGPVITMFEFEPGPGVKVAQVANRDDDLAMALRAESIRIVAPIPGKGAVGIEVPNDKRQLVSLRELINSNVFQKSVGKLPIVLGKNIGGRVRVADLAAMPHLLVAGTTGSGKSVFINSLICSLLYRCSPAYLRMLLIDPKMLELSDYTEIPHLLHPVVTDPRKAAVILNWAVSEMEDRYRKMADMGVRNVENYNEKVEKVLAGKIKPPAAVEEAQENDDEPLGKMPYILTIIDEFSDLMIVASKDVEESVTRLAQMARAAGIHLILATQRPSVDVITGVIKANFPARISFKVSSRVDSRTILDQIGSESLLGNGDMLFLPPTASKIERIHSPLVTEEEIQRVVGEVRKSGEPQYDPHIVRASEHADDPGALGNGFGLGLDNGEDELVERAWEIIRNERKASISYIQRRMKIGYNKAARIIEVLEMRGFISPSDGTSRPREILAPTDEEN